MIKECKICGKKIKVKREKVGSKGSSKDTFSYSDEGVYFEDGKCWFCNEHWNELFNASKINYLDILHGV